MKKMKVRALAVVLGVMMSAGMIGTMPADVQAAKKKLSVNRVYEQSTRIKGKTKGKYVVKVRIGKRTYKAKASKKGKFSIKVPKVKAGKKYTVKAYKGKKYYTKKTIYVIAKKLRLNKFTANSKTISGYTRPSYKVKVTINKTTYAVKANKNSGYFKVKLKKKAGTGNAVVKVYDTKGKKTVSQTQKHSHAWEKQYKTVHHPEAGHYETVVVPAWDEKKQEEHWICYGCKLDLNVEYEKYKANWEERKKLYPDEDYCDTLSSFCTLHRYILNNGCTSSWHDELVDVTIHHDATTKKQWVIDKKAYDEKVIVGYRCDCGAKK
ncbi:MULTISPECIES: hypothetical protein [Anaerostipes]|uniref:Bacterial Ig domain-containing protein n=2 Tax=Anaerostipes TaxID=207244 RepID=A0ABV4DJ65_9FIRM|nr:MULTISPECIES: hypothetical protein [Anaerostipes]MBC5677261.1 hypothetical protein [Anaerostipes hominis (ex Liu et al. 2021)]